MRGTQVRINLKVLQVRITPAGAGNTINPIVRVFQNQDHPRRCGEHDGLMLGICNGFGSPPQVRGTQLYAINERSAIRITPAGAGNTIKEIADYLMV